MLLHYLAGGLALILVLGLVVVTFWKGARIPPDPHNRQDGGLPPGGFGPG